MYECISFANEISEKIINERGLILTDIEITTKQYQLK